MFELDTNNFEKSHREAKDYLSRQKKELIKITDPFWSDSLEQKRKNELSHVAKFILCLDKAINLEQMMESPDFIISQSVKTIWT